MATRRQISFRLDEEMERNIEAIRDYFAAQGVVLSTTDATRYALRQARAALPAAARPAETATPRRRRRAGRSMAEPKDRETDLFHACEFMQRKIGEGVTLAKELGGDSSSDMIELSDGSTIRCQSRCGGPYSEVTPDLDFDPPRFFIYDAQA